MVPGYEEDLDVVYGLPTSEHFERAKGDSDLWLVIVVSILLGILLTETSRELFVGVYL